MDNEKPETGMYKQILSKTTGVVKNHPAITLAIIIILVLILIINYAKTHGFLQKIPFGKKLSNYIDGKKNSKSQKKSAKDDSDSDSDDDSSSDDESAIKELTKE
jgi:hypothetical protein